MKTVIIGAGAIGGVSAAYMAQGGADVTLVCKRQTAAETIEHRGIHIIGKRGEHTIPTKAVPTVADLKETYDIALIATKAYDMPQVAQEIIPFMNENGLIVSFQNGICIDRLAEIVGEERAVQAVVTWSCTMIADAEYEFTAEGGFIVGSANGTVDVRIEQLKELLDLVAPTRISDNILSEMYSKLIINSAITCGGALTGVKLGTLLKDKYAQQFFIHIVQEDIALANAMGIKVPPFGGQLDYYKFAAGDGWTDRIRRLLTLRVVGMKYRDLKSSSLCSLERGGKTEVDILNGWITEKANQYGVSVPVNAKITEMIKQIERKERVSILSNMKELMQTAGKE
ncbi:MAG: ketopantoate reductase family protein [Anaerofustis sp.]